MSTEDSKAAESTDPASSLRAAALLTLKAKRRKLSSEALSRPVPTPVPAVQLDYGQEETASSPAVDEQLREEGEISDSEDVSKAQQKSNSPVKKLPPPPPPPLDTSPRRSLSVKVESPTHSLLESSTVYPDRPVYAVDSNHIRPGLEMNQAQYDTAKDIVLDLLGWGVPPEYLLDCGLSREIIFYVFSELNLRLPENLDTTGLVPYLPMEPLAARPSDVARVPTQPSLPQQPSPSTSESAPPAGNLHDMERQRRQELLARKAVQASRKAKPHPPSPDPSSSNQDVEMLSAVPTETVDDFLNSIDPSSRSPNVASDDAMNVDDVPGLQGTKYADTDVPLIVNQLTVSPTSSLFLRETEPASMRAEIAESRRGSESSEEQSSQGQVQRRGSKRPVAADFVDVDSQLHAIGTSQPRLVRRKLGGSFATVSTMRRCVIDLSDSEGEDSVMHDAPDEPEQRGGDYSLPTPSSMAGTPAPEMVAPKTPPLLYRTSSPAALLEKEKEIMKMRQLIAQREQNSRAKKLTKLSSIATAADVSEESKLDHEASQQTDRDLSEQTHPDARSNGTSTSGTSPIDDHPIANGGITEETQASPNDQQTQVVLSVDAQDSQQEASNVDVDLAMSSSAQPTKSVSPSKQEENPVQLPANPESFSSYSSLFDSYPLLRSRSRPLAFTTEKSSAFLPSPLESSLSSSSITSIATISTLPSLSFSTRSRSSSSSSVQSHHSEPHLSLPDLVPLKLAIISKLLDPSKRICQYEVPGGGICRDEGCEDIHLNRISTGLNGGLFVEPSDEDTATYLSTALPATWLSGFDSTSQLSLKISDALQQARLDNPSMVFEERVAWALTALEPSLSALT